MMQILPNIVIRPHIQRALEEDLGRNGDITSNAVIAPDTLFKAHITAHKPGIASGVQLARNTFELVDPNLEFSAHIHDGDPLDKGTIIAKISGKARSVLMAERVALNYLGHLSGIASITHMMAQLIAHTKARITCTRKTTPGLRTFEKQAVAHGGGIHHRFALDDAILIKDNHIAAAGGIQKVLDAANRNKSHMIKIMIEVDNLDQLDQVLRHGGADNVMLDNFSLKDLTIGVEKINGRMNVEASGNVTPDTVAAIAKTGVNTISSGYITHSAASLDISLDAFAS